MTTNVVSDKMARYSFGSSSNISASSSDRERPRFRDANEVKSDNEPNAVRTARFVKGNVGMARGAFKKLRIFKASSRHGVLVINIDDGGTVMFYYNTILNRPGVIGETIATVTERVSKISVEARVTSFVKPSEEPYLCIPANVPWKFKAVGNYSFQIIVPPINGKLDHRVEVRKYAYMLKKRMMSNHEDDTADDSEIKNDTDSSKNNSQVFTFRCQHSGELTVYAKAAQSIGRNRNHSGTRSHSMTSGKKTSMISIIPKSNKSNVRTRNAAGKKIAKQMALIDRSASVANFQLRRLSTGDEQEYRVYPLYCYPNMWMTKRDIVTELPRSSKTFYDLRRDTPDTIGNLKVEVLQCSGLPKMDKYGLTDAYCFIVCGSSCFVTDVIPKNLNPCWLPMTRRACIIPIHNAYSQVYVGVFDYDGEKTTDDYIGRVVIDISQLQSQLQSGSRLMNVTLPLRDCSRAYSRKRLGSIRLRLQLDWSERAALLSYLPRNLSDITKRIKSPRDPVTVECPDAKSFYNIALTVYGKDIPGRYTKTMKEALAREIVLIKKMLVYHAKRTAMDIFRWRNPALSLYLFYGWMYFVVMNSGRFLFAFILSLIFIFMVRNYLKYHVNSASSKLFGSRTIVNMTRILLLDRDGATIPTPHFTQSTMLGRAFLRILGMPQIDAHPQDSWKYEDHAEFPFSTGSVHTKVSSDEAAASSIWEAAQDARIGNKSEEFIDESCRVFDDSSRDFVDTDDESYDEYLDTFENAEVEIGKTSSKNTAQCRIILPTQEHNPTSLPNLPDQNVCNASVRGKTLSAQLIGWHSKVEKANLHLFDDRVFIAEDKADAEKVLKMNTTRNPIARMINPLMANVLKIFDYEVHAFRAVFNILFWKDPMLSYWAMGLVCCLIIFVLVFPWRIFFFVVGLFGLGPQNYFLVDWYHYKSAMQEPAHEPLSSSTKSLNTHYKSELVNSEEGSNTPPEGSTGNGHLLNNSPLLLRNNIQMKPDGKLRKVIVPSIPFRHNRFYDWPPDPNLITIR